MSGCLHAQSPASDVQMNAFIDDLMGRMTLEEKIGQLNLLSVGFDVTGPQLSLDVETQDSPGPGGRGFERLHAGGGAEAAIAGRQRESFGHPAAVWIRCDSRPQDDFPDPAWSFLHLEPGCNRAERAHCRDGSERRWRELDVLADGGYRPGPAVGKNCGRSGRRPVSGRADRPGDGAWLPGRRPQPEQRADGVRKAFCLIRRGGGGPRLQHGGYEPPQDVPVLPAAVPGGGGGRSRQRHDFLQ